MLGLYLAILVMVAFGSVLALPARGCYKHLTRVERKRCDCQ